jgi:hypothetical protein
MNDLVNMRTMWYAFGMQRGPVKQMEVMIKEIVQIGHENGRKKLLRRENLRASLHICPTEHGLTYMLQKLEYLEEQWAYSGLHLILVEDNYLSLKQEAIHI